MLMIPEKLTADREQIARFVNVLFRNCVTKTGLPYGGLVALRAFGPNNSVAHVSWAALPDVIDRATEVATSMARKDAVVFCPPVCLFKDAEKRSAREVDILAAPVIATDFDKEPDKGRAALEAVLGQPTLVVASGGLWQGQQNAHLYWRLKEPAVGPEQIALLKAVRKKAVELSGGDPTNVPACHPLRWPGSWHTKSTPALCRIVDEAPDVELALEDAAHMLGVDPEQVARERREKEERKGSDTEDNPVDVLRATEYLAAVREKGVPAEGNGSDNFTYGIIAKLRDFGVSEYTACDLLDEHFTPHTSFDAEWVEAKVANAYKHAQNPPGVKSITTLFDVLPDPEPVSEASALFAEVDLNALKKEQAEAPEPIKWVRPRDWQGVEPPEREWDVVGWVPRYEVTLLYGDGGIGKTLAIHQLATAMAAGVAWLGQETRQRRVMCFFCEDSEDELLRRQIDINRALGVDWDAIDDRLRIASRKYMDNLLALWDRNTGAMKRSAVWEQLRRDAVEFDADVLIVDTIADTHGGSEIDRGQVNAFVKSCLGRLAKAINGSVIALGHPSMSGKSTGSGTSGSTAWSNAVRSRMYLRYPKGVEKGNIRELEGMKLNYGPKGNLLKLRWHSGAFDLVASSKPASEGAAVRAALVAGASIETVAREAVLTAFRRCPEARMSMSAQSLNYAPKVLKRMEPELLEALSFGEVEEAVRRLEREGAIAAGKVGSDASRRAVQGIIVRDIVSDDDGIFG